MRLLITYYAMDFYFLSVVLFYLCSHLFYVYIYLILLYDIYYKACHVLKML